MALNIPKVISKDPDFNKWQDVLARVLYPILNSPLVRGSLLTDIQLEIGSNKVSHKLDRKLVGWYIVRQRGGASIYDTQDTNPNPTIFLSLVSDTSVNVDLFVF